MIRAEFVIRDNKFCGFSIRGHAGSAPAPHDLVCCAVSAMSALTVNTLKEVFSAPLSIEEDERKPLLAVSLSGECPRPDSAEGVIRGFYLQLKDLEKQYPKFLRVSADPL